MSFLIPRSERVEMPDFEKFLPWVTGLVGTIGGAFVAGRRLWFKDRQDSRKDGEERRIDGAYDEVIAIMRQQIRDSTLDRAQMREQLDHCLVQHAECREETNALRLETEGLRIRIEELERMP